MNATDINAIAHDLAMECAEDYVGLWVIPSMLQNAGLMEGNGIEQTINVIRTLSNQVDIVFGQFANSTFVLWNEDLDHALHKIEAEWKSLGRSPDIGEIVWIAAR